MTMARVLAACWILLTGLGLFLYYWSQSNKPWHYAVLALVCLGVPLSIAYVAAVWAPPAPFGWPLTWLETGLLIGCVAGRAALMRWYIRRFEQARLRYAAVKQALVRQGIYTGTQHHHEVWAEPEDVLNRAILNYPSLIPKLSLIALALTSLFVRHQYLGLLVFLVACLVLDPLWRLTRHEGRLRASYSWEDDGGRITWVFKGEPALFAAGDTALTILIWLTVVAPPVAASIARVASLASSMGR